MFADGKGASGYSSSMFMKGGIRLCPTNWKELKGLDLALLRGISFPGSKYFGGLWMRRSAFQGAAGALQHKILKEAGK
ncbi:MAG: hypothetical protein M1379_05775 [Firmicutes bacterium]|nr:hypothetical protein [Bacillota bacterium]